MESAFLHESVESHIEVRDDGLFLLHHLVASLLDPYYVVGDKSHPVPTMNCDPVGVWLSCRCR